MQFVVGGRVDYTDLLADKLTFSPRATLTIEASPVTNFSVAGGVYRQLPGLLWLEADPRNHDLQPARVDQFVLGVEHLPRADLRLRLEGFLKRYADYPASVDRPYLVLANVGGGYGGSEDNFASFGLDHLVSAGKGRARGIEFLLQKKLSEIPLYGIMSLTWAQTLFAPIDGVERPGAYDQEVIGSLSGGYRFNERWEVSARFRVATGRPYTPFNDDGTQDVAQLYGERLDPFHSLDLRVDRRWSFERWNLIVYLDVQNVYNNKYVSGYRWNARERKAEPIQSSIGVIPTLGVSAEF
jgi:hypothetical protein